MRKLIPIMGVICVTAMLSQAPVMGQCEGYWNDITPLSFPASETCSAVVDGKIYLFGDYNSSANNNAARVYDPATNTWRDLPPMPTGRGEAACAAVGGVIYVFGGNNCFSNCWLSTVEAFDTTNETWITGLPDLPHPFPNGGRGWLTASAVDDRIYVMGGVNSYYPPTCNYVCIFDPTTDSWLPDGQPMPVPRAHHGAAVLNGKIYVVGGNYRIVHNEPQYPLQVDVYDPALDQWEAGGAPPIPAQRIELASAEAAGRIYAIGGAHEDASGVKASVLELDPVLNCWRAVTPLPHPRYNHCAAAVDGQIYVFGGKDDTSSSLESNSVGVPRQIPGDNDGDGDVDLSDLALLLANYGMNWD